MSNFNNKQIEEVQQRAIGAIKDLILVTEKTAFELFSDYQSTIEQCEKYCKDHPETGDPMDLFAFINFWVWDFVVEASIEMKDQLEEEQEDFDGFTIDLPF